MHHARLLLVLAAVALSPPIEATAQALRVATFNVNWANRRGDELVAAVEAADADILCLQETTLQSEAFLRQRLAERYPEFHAAGHRGKYGAERLVIASKAKPRHLRFHPPDGGLFGFLVATYEWGDVEVRVVNVHLAPFLIPRGGGLRDTWKALRATEATHAREIDAILSQVDASRPTIIAGDFNSPSAFVAPARLREKGLIDSFAAVHADADGQATWRWPSRPLPLSLRIDYIFHTGHFRTTASEIITRGGSDHFLVVSELERRLAAPRSETGVSGTGRSCSCSCS